jgi:hypothetical protein
MAVFLSSVRANMPGNRSSAVRPNVNPALKSPVSTRNLG